MTRRTTLIIIAVALVLALVVGVRRWVHHAQLELVPVMILPGSDVSTVVSPPPSRVLSRMLLDVHELVQPPARPRLAVLTFDDGPYPVETPALAAMLASLHVPADFFLIGEDTMREPEIARRLRAQGIELGNHTLTHPEMPALSSTAQTAEITSGAAAIRASTGAQVRFFRPPHGNYNTATIDAAIGPGNEIVALWDVDPGDWRDVDADQITASTEQQGRAPAIILLHDGKDATIDALPRIVEAYRRAGFEFVTLSELQARVPIDVINDPVKVQL